MIQTWELFWDYVSEYGILIWNIIWKVVLKSVLIFISYLHASDIINISIFYHRKLILWMTAASITLSFGPQDRGVTLHYHDLAILMREGKCHTLPNPRPQPTKSPSSMLLHKRNTMQPSPYLTPPKSLPPLNPILATQVNLQER